MLSPILIGADVRDAYMCGVQQEWYFLSARLVAVFFILCTTCQRERKRVHDDKEAAAMRFISALSSAEKCSAGDRFDPTNLLLARPREQEGRLRGHETTPSLADRCCIDIPCTASV